MYRQSADLNEHRSASKGNDNGMGISPMNAAGGNSLSQVCFALCAFDHQYCLVDGEGDIEPVNFNVLIVQRDSILQGVLQQNRRDRVVHGVRVRLVGQVPSRVRPDMK